MDQRYELVSFDAPGSFKKTYAFFEQFSSTFPSNTFGGRTIFTANGDLPVLRFDDEPFLPLLGVSTPESNSDPASTWIVLGRGRLGVDLVRSLAGLIAFNTSLSMCFP